jgi:hypothetical protein
MKAESKADAHALLPLPLWEREGPIASYVRAKPACDGKVRVLRGHAVPLSSDSK